MTTASMTPACARTACPRARPTARASSTATATSSRPAPPIRAARTARACMPCQAAADNKSSIGCDYYARRSRHHHRRRGRVLRGVHREHVGLAGLDHRRARRQSLPIDGFARIPTGQGQTHHVRAADRTACCSRTRSRSCSSRGSARRSTELPGRHHARGHRDRRRRPRHRPRPRVPHHDLGADRRVRHLPLRRRQLGRDERDAAPADLGVGHELRRGRRVPQERRSVAAGAAVHRARRRCRTARTSRSARRAAIVGGTGVAAAAQGANTTYTLAKGQVLQFTQDAELSGSAITADEPIGVWGGATCLQHRRRPRPRATPRTSRSRRSRRSATATPRCAIATGSQGQEETRAVAHRRRRRRHAAHLHAGGAAGRADDAEPRPGRRVQLARPVRRRRARTPITRSTCPRT